jgi:diaminopimelate decarboxylase
MFDQQTLESFQELETPFYFYDLHLLKGTVLRIAHEASQLNYKLHYALKANANPKILKVIAEAGLGADCVSGGEIMRALECGITKEKIVYAGVGKADWEIKLALENDIFCFNCESMAEIEVINEIASEMDKTANIAIRINPHVDAATHKYITTGLNENKFGIDITKVFETIKAINKLKNINLIGLHFHIGSQITDMDSFINLCFRINDLQDDLEKSNITVSHINVGGGLGIDYNNPNFLAVPDFYSYFAIFAKFLELRQGQTLHFEPGRSVIANCGTLVTKVLYVKEGLNKKFAIVDAGMTELIRPALYDATHTIEHTDPSNDKDKYDIVGPICESSDFFAKDIEMPKIKRGDLLAIRSVGAYGECMQSEYNLRRRAVSVFS